MNEWVSKPSGTKYYDFKNNVYVWINASHKVLAEVYRIEIVDHDVITVYSYKNNRTYTMRR